MVGLRALPAHLSMAVAGWHGPGSLPTCLGPGWPSVHGACPPEHLVGGVSAGPREGQGQLLVKFSVWGRALPKLHLLPRLHLSPAAREAGAGSFWGQAHINCAPEPEGQAFSPGGRGGSRVKRCKVRQASCWGSGCFLSSKGSGAQVPSGRPAACSPAGGLTLRPSG